jgi:TonB family protein
MSRLIAVFLVLFAIESGTVIAQVSETSLHSRQLVHKVAPVYPDLAKRTHLSGVVKLQATIATNGSVTSIRVVGGNPVFVQAAQDAVAKWKYAPAPDETSALVELDFNTPN